MGGRLQAKTILAFGDMLAIQVGAPRGDIATTPKLSEKKTPRQNHGFKKIATPFWTTFF